MASITMNGVTVTFSEVDTKDLMKVQYDCIRLAMGGNNGTQIQNTLYNDFYAMSDTMTDCEKTTRYRSIRTICQLVSMATNAGPRDPTRVSDEAARFIKKLDKATTNGADIDNAAVAEKVAVSIAGIQGQDGIIQGDEMDGSEKKNEAVAAERIANDGDDINNAAAALRRAGDDNAEREGAEMVVQDDQIIGSVALDDAAHNNAEIPNANVNDEINDDVENAAAALENDDGHVIAGEDARAELQDLEGDANNNDNDMLELQDESDQEPEDGSEEFADGLAQSEHMNSDSEDTGVEVDDDEGMEGESEGEETEDEGDMSEEADNNTDIDEEVSDDGDDIQNAVPADGRKRSYVIISDEDDVGMEALPQSNSKKVRLQRRN